MLVVYSKHGEVPPLPGPRLNIIRILFWNCMTLALAACGRPRNESESENAENDESEVAPVSAK